MHVHLLFHIVIYLLDTLQSTNAELTVTIERLEEERDDEIQRVQELMMESTQLQISKEKL